MTELERQELEALKERTGRLDGPNTLTPDEMDRFFELLLKEHELS
ncbi:hypothetical protein [Streptococcus sp. sy018]|nr:hypothetical protein [Streptococcus sp. sy018]